MRSLLLPAFVLIAGFALATTPQGSKAGDDAGQAEFVRYCSSCHGMDADGTGPVAETLKKPPPDLRLIAARRDGVFPQAAVMRIIDGRDPVIAHGLREMPVWGEEFRAEVPSGPSAESMARGRALLLTRYLQSIQIEAEAE